MSWTDALSKIKSPVAPLCVTCGVSMRLRTNKKDGSSFWGCTNYPDCKKTRVANITLNTGGIVLTSEQISIRDDNRPEVSVIATAGSGKTAALIAKAKHSKKPFIFLTFNRKTAKEANSRFGSLGVCDVNNAMTLHAAAWKCAN